ncbi:MAG: hypothetical protein JW936_10120 [Sedimentisphaerales bacterium]|nr:hypothetical protein [Sedimentisphaerales bacterium]
MTDNQGQSSGELGGLGPSIRLPSLPHRLGVVERMMSEAIVDPRVANYRGRAQFAFFCGADPENLAGYDGQLEAVGRCLEWFVFDYVIPELGKTPGQHWFDQNAEQLDGEQRRDARHCLKFLLGLFEVGQVEPGKGCHLLDLLRDPLSYVVHEEIVSKEIQLGQLVLGRLFPYHSGYTFSGMIAVMEQAATEQIKRAIVQGELDVGDFLQRLDGLELENLLDRRPQQIEEQFDLEDVYRHLGRYLEICGAKMTIEDLRRAVGKAPEPLRVAADLAAELEICGRHEMDLFFTYVTTAWRLNHQ